MTAVNPPGASPPRMVFVIGTGRCGSTLVEEVLARHGDVGFVTSYEDRLPAVRLTGRVAAPVYRRLPLRLSTKGRGRLYPSEGYRVLGAQVSPALASPTRDLVAEDATPWLAERTRAFFARHAQAQGRPVFMHKFTGWPRARFLAAVFPDARFIHVVRDGRAVASSLLQMPWWEGWGGPERWTFGPLPATAQEAWEEHDRSFAVLAGLQWSLLVDAFRVSRGEIGESRWLEVRYEDLLEDPRSICEDLLGFCGLPWTAAFGKAFSRYSFGSSRSDAYRDDLGELVVKRLDSVIGDTLRSYGYSLS